MSTVDVVGLLVSVALLGYLFYALVRGEDL